MSIKTDYAEAAAIEQYLCWDEAGQPAQTPRPVVQAMQTQLQGQIVNARRQRQLTIFQEIVKQARRCLRESKFADPVPDIGPADYEVMPRRAIWSVAPNHDIYMTASGLQWSTDQTTFQSDDPKLLCVVNMGMVWLIRDQNTLQWLIDETYRYRTTAARIKG